MLRRRFGPLAAFALSGAFVTFLLLSAQGTITVSLRDAPFAWNTVAVPVLARPCWVIPAAIGIVAGGLSISLRPRPRGARRRRTGSGRS